MRGYADAVTGIGDSIRINAWLPLDELDWTGRFLGQGGGGWVSTLHSA